MAAAACAVSLAAAVSTTQAAEPSSLRAVLDAHLCDLTERLTRIHRSTDPRRTARHIVVQAEDGPDAYVQCRFLARDTRMECEAASGHHRSRAAPRPPLPRDAGALAALGFVARADGNDRREIALEGPDSLGEVAVLMLRALHDGYGFRAPAPLLVRAPLARLPARASSGCVPTS